MVPESVREGRVVSLPQKFVYSFGGGTAEGNASMKDILGGKGANLAAMARLGLPVPPGFTVSTEICSVYYRENGLSPAIKSSVLQALGQVELVVGRKFGDPQNPLLVSVRSGARASMPGMMDTILNLGLNDQTVQGLIASTGNARFAWDSYRRFIQMYSDVVMGMNGSLLEVALEDLKEARGVHLDTDLSAEDLKLLTEKFKRQVLETTGQRFPTDTFEQLWGAISAVFRSWNTPRAKTYRGLHAIPESWGTAVNVQAMVFGNLGDDSATGVAFTRNPSTGVAYAGDRATNKRIYFGEFLVNAQGEDVVAGIRTPQPISELEKIMPTLYHELTQIFSQLETNYRDMQDIEFTIERGRLWMLQTRNGKRTAQAALKIACDMIDEKLIDEDEALLRIDPSSLNQLLHPMLDPKADRKLLARGLPASPGAVSGGIVFTSEEAEEVKASGKKCILVRVETSPEDINGMVASVGILTSRGGMTSHAAVVARGMGKCCVAGCADIEINSDLGEMRVAGYLLRRGDWITLDGSTGDVFSGEVQTVDPELGPEFDRIMKLADKKRKLRVRANADVPVDAQLARQFGAEGIGLCRTEHMFFDPDRIDVVRRMILADGTAERESVLQELLPMQRSDFAGLFEAMQGFPVTIRLLDPPLHEFLPHSESEVAELADRIGMDSLVLRQKVHALHEFNPMLGHRGCRLAVTFPEIYAMQVRAISEAAVAVIRKGVQVSPEIMIPLTLEKAEMGLMRQLVHRVVDQVEKEAGQKLTYWVGTMIELPRAALLAHELAEEAEFFSFGTNDLTQTTLGLSRDDAGRFLGAYVAQGIFEVDPFISIDKKGVGSLVRMATELGRKTNKSLKVGVCGEHGGDPASIEFFHSSGLDYVSCSPYRVPIARLAAARAAILDRTR